MNTPEIKAVNLPDKDVFIKIETNFDRNQVGYTSRINIHSKKRSLTKDQVAEIVGAILSIFDGENHGT